ncbi:MAG TPA: hypothetical protein VGM62_16095 [Chthoniobacterales bacterium]
MKKNTALGFLVGLTLTGMLLASCATNSSTTGSASAANGGQLIVGRTANFGGITVVILSVDGKKVANIPRGQTYRGSLTPGKHSISATIEPNNLNSPPSTKALNVEVGKTYSFTATWRADQMVLLQN